MSGPLSKIPNQITLARIAAIPLIGVLLVLGGDVGRMVALVVYVVAAGSDWVDGYLARKLNQGSALGRMLDPIADKLLVGVLLIVFAFTGDFTALDLVPAGIILTREILVSGLREYLGPKNVVVHVTGLAKWKTTVQLVALGVVIAQPLLPVLGIADSVLLWLAAVLTFWTGLQYFTASWPHLSGD